MGSDANGIEKEEILTNGRGIEKKEAGERRGEDRKMRDVEENGEKEEKTRKEMEDNGK